MPTLRQQQLQQQISPQQAQTIKAQLNASPTQPHAQSQLMIHKPTNIETATPTRTQQPVGQHEAAIQHDIASQSAVAGDDKGNNFCADPGVVDENGKIRFKRLFLTRKKASGKCLTDWTGLHEIKFEEKGIPAMHPNQWDSSSKSLLNLLNFLIYIRTRCCLLRAEVHFSLTCTQKFTNLLR